jgi:hypothetical protein
MISRKFGARVQMNLGGDEMGCGMQGPGIQSRGLVCERIGILHGAAQNLNGSFSHIRSEHCPQAVRIGLDMSVALTAFPSRSTKSLDLLLFLLSAFGFRLLPLCEISPATDALLAALLPSVIVLSLPLPLSCFFIILLLLSTLFSHLGFHLALLPHFIVAYDPDGLLSPLLPELVAPRLFVVGCELLLTHKQHTGVCYILVKLGAQLLVEQHRLRFLEAIEGIGCEWVLGLVGMYEERLCAVHFLDVGFWYTWLETKDCIGVETEDIADSCDCQYYNWRSNICHSVLLSISSS